VAIADSDCFVIPDGVRDEQALFCSDAAPTGYMRADFCDIKPGWRWAAVASSNAA
jgi:hypothetical protein